MCCMELEEEVWIGRMVDWDEKEVGLLYLFGLCPFPALYPRQ